VKGFSREHLQTAKIDAVPAIKLHVPAREIITDHAYEFDRTEEAGRYGGVTG
jgi:hypothetical protein